MSWWDYGYQIAGMANRTTLVDNNTWNNSHIALVGKAMSSNETAAYRVSYLKGKLSSFEAVEKFLSHWNNAFIVILLARFWCCGNNPENPNNVTVKTVSPLQLRPLISIH